MFAVNVQLATLKYSYPSTLNRYQAFCFLLVWLSHFNHKLGPIFFRKTVFKQQTSYFIFYVETRDRSRSTYLTWPGYKEEEKKKKPVEKGSAMQETSWNSSRLQADLDSFDIEMPKIEYSDNDNN